MTGSVRTERDHQDAWYERAVSDRFFEREGFKQLIAWNLELFRRAVPLSPSSRVLSLGCGTGEYELQLAPSVGALRAVDLSPVAIGEARRRARERQVAGLTFEEGSILDIDVAPASFDVVYALGVLHHLGRDQRTTLFAHVRQWLVPGGWFYARDPNARGLLRRTAGRWFRHSSFHSPNEDALDPRAVATELTVAGFVDVHVGYADVLAGPLPWLIATPARRFWNVVFAFDRAWLGTPGLRALASQFDVRARR